jgi:transposase-like protein
MQATKPLPEELNLANILTTFATDANARKFLESLLWKSGPVCPRCQTNDQSRIAKDKGKTAREGLYRCNDCRRTFTVTVGTIFEDSHVPIRKWIIALFLIASSKKGFSSLQLQRVLGLGSYRTALFMADRIRFALTETAFANKIKGTVEVDECYFGPISRKKADGSRRIEKSAVMALVERESGQRRSVVIERVTAKNLHQAVVDHVEAGSTVNTDESPLYIRMPKQFTHKTVRHAKLRGKREYHRVEANGEVVTTNYAESSFSLLRRGVIGTFHNLSRKYLPLYVGEFDFRFNARKVSDGERMVAAIAKTKGRRVTLKQLKGGHATR